MEIGCSNDVVSPKRTIHTPAFHSPDTLAVARELDFGNHPNHHHSSKGASFIALLAPHFDKQLQIPHEFTKIFVGCVPHRFIIESSTSKKCWRVEVGEEGDGSVYFREGWADFVEAHSLQVGEFLLFEYDEQSIFQVKIYNKDGCQKMVEDGRGDKLKLNSVKIFDFEEHEESDEPKKLGTIRPYPQKTRKTNSQRKYGRGTYKKKQAFTKSYTRTATVSFSGDKVVFSVKIHRHKQHQFYSLTLPRAISSTKNLEDEVIIQDAATGNRWPVKVNHRNDGRAILSHGWKQFSKDNLSAGDTLSLEFVSDGLIQASVVKDSQNNGDDAVSPNMDCEVLDDHATVSDELVEEEEESVSTKRGRKRVSSEYTRSSFTFLWRPTTKGSYLHIPKIVIEGQNLMNKESVVLRGPDGKCWPLEVSTRRDGRVALTKGWVEFWKGHDIKPGDSLHFDFVSEHFVQVNINRGKLPLDSPLSSGQHDEHIAPLNLTDHDDDDDD